MVHGEVGQGRRQRRWLVDTVCDVTWVPPVELSRQLQCFPSFVNSLRWIEPETKLTDPNKALV